MHEDCQGRIDLDGFLTLIGRIKAGNFAPLRLNLAAMQVPPGADATADGPAAHLRPRGGIPAILRPPT